MIATRVASTAYGCPDNPVFWPKGTAGRPDLRLDPLSWCPGCEQQVRGVQSWRSPRRPQWGRYRQQYDYRCPSCAGIVWPYAHAAANAIDWAHRGTRIGDRKRPLAAATIRRIEVGLERYAHAVAMHLGGSIPAASVADPIRTVFASNPQALLVPVSRGHDPDGRRARPAIEPAATQTVRLETGLATVPFIAELYGTATARPVTDPLSTVTAKGNHHGLTTPPEAWLVANYGGDPAKGKGGWVRPVGAPFGTVTTRDHHALLVPSGGTWNEDAHPLATRPMPTQTTREAYGVAQLPDALAEHLLVPYHRTGVARPVTEPANTQTTRDRDALVAPAPAIEDCEFRMLEPYEVKAAMAFDRGYQILGTKRDQVALAGNAVTPPAMQLLVERVGAGLGTGRRS